MKITHKRELYVERERRVTIRFANRQSLRFCPVCRTDAPFLTADEAAILRQTTSREIFHLTEAEQIHWIETDEGLLLICLASLAVISNQTQIIKQEK